MKLMILSKSDIFLGYTSIDDGFGMVVPEGKYK